METERVRKKGHTKKKLRLFKILTVVMATLFVLSAALSGWLLYSSSKGSDDLKTQIDGLRNELTELTEKNAALESQILSLGSENDAVTAKYNELSAATSQFQTTITELQTQISGVSAENDKLTADYATVTKDLESAKSSNKTLSDKNSSLSSNISSLEKQLKTLKDENTALRETIEMLGATVPDAGGSDDGDDTTGSDGDDEIPEETETASAETSATTKIAYLTFDDGVSKYTDTILDTLAKYNIKATFFPNWKGSSDAKYKRIHDEGHVIGNHTYSHEYDDVYTTLDGFISEVTRLNDKISAVTGYTPTIFRFPGGSNNTVHQKRNPDIMQQAIKALYEMNMEYYDWNLNSGDADSSAGASKNTIVKNVLNGATRDKIIILMHDTNTKGTTVEALPEIIEGLIEKGYSFGVLTDEAAPVVHSLKPAE